MSLNDWWCNSSVVLHHVHCHQYDFLEQQVSGFSRHFGLRDAGFLTS